jgi:16S rRNA (adenine1518-N6/adenine1519-N6)-dimethyltransferase
MQMNFKPKHHLGQNFLQDKEVLKDIVAAADLKSTDTVLEIGPGLGSLTAELLEVSSKVIAVEKDSKLVKHLKDAFSENKKIRVVEEDILKFDLNKEIPGPYKVVANIPYYLTSKIFQYFLEIQNQPDVLILMVQKEVGQRVVAKPGDLSILGISVQIYADVEIIRKVSKESFWPMPEVDSVILKITPKEKYPEIKDKELFFRIIKIAFAAKRKQIQNNLANGLKLPKEKVFELLKKTNINPLLRPQDLNIKQWIDLIKLLES